MLKTPEVKKIQNVHETYKNIGYCVATVIINYFIQKALSVAFLFFNKCEQSRSTLIQLLNNVPDAVIVLKPVVTIDVYNDDCVSTTPITTQFKTKYCNERVDEFFNLDLSKLNEQELEDNGH